MSAAPMVPASHRGKGAMTGEVASQHRAEPGNQDEGRGDQRRTHPDEG